LVPVLSSSNENGGSSSATSSQSTIYVSSALSESFWTETTTVTDDEWTTQITSTETATETPITETVAQTLETELLKELQTNLDAQVEEIVVKELEETLSVSERINLEIKDVNTSIGIAKVENDSVVVQISTISGKKQFKIKINETSFVDLNNDSLNDIKISVVNIDANQKVGIKIAVVYNGLLSAREIPEYEQEQKSNRFLLLALTVVGFLVVITVFLRFRKYK
jgi:DNA-binding protein Fis